MSPPAGSSANQQEETGTGQPRHPPSRDNTLPSAITLLASKASQPANAVAEVRARTPRSVTGSTSYGGPRSASGFSAPLLADSLLVLVSRNLR